MRSDSMIFMTESVYGAIHGIMDVVFRFRDQVLPQQISRSFGSEMPRKKKTSEAVAEAPRIARPRLSTDDQKEPNFNRRGEATFDRLMRIVASMYRERGYERTSMSMLARRAGLTPPALYHYFGKKEDILAVFLEYTLNDLREAVQPALKSKTWTAKLERFVKLLVKWQLNQTPFSEAYDRIFELGQLRNSLPDPYRAKVLDLEREIYEVCRQIVAGGIEAGEFREVPVAPTVFAIIALGDYTLGWYRHDGPLTHSQLGDTYADLAIAMLRKSDAPRPSED